jgi:hypothetical protein
MVTILQYEGEVRQYDGDSMTGQNDGDERQYDRLGNYNAEL